MKETKLNMKFKVPNILRELTIQPLLNKSLKKQTRKEKNIVFGGRSIQAQIGMAVARPTTDWDIFSKKPKKSARRTEKNFDRLWGSDHFYTQPALHPGTHKVMSKGSDGRKGTRDDFGVVDYSKMPKPRPRTTRILGVTYRKLSTEKAKKFKALRDKTQKFRHKKDRDDVERIKLRTGQRR